MQTILHNSYGYEIKSPYRFDETVARVRDAFKQEGFGVLSEIDVQKTLKEKLGENMPPYMILGMCNPALAHRAIEAEPMIGLLLPCNVVVQERRGSVCVDVQDPAAMMMFVGNPMLGPIGKEAGEKIRKAIESSVSEATNS